jgi:hypothetical protein
LYPTADYEVLGEEIAAGFSPSISAIVRGALDTAVRKALRRRKAKDKLARAALATVNDQIKEGT